MWRFCSLLPTDRYPEAVALYSKAIAVAEQHSAPPQTARTTSTAASITSTAPEATAAASKLQAACYTNRAACFFMLRQYRKCADDCSKAVTLDPTYVKVPYVSELVCGQSFCLVIFFFFTAKNVLASFLFVRKVCFLSLQ